MLHSCLLDARSGRHVNKPSHYRREGPRTAKHDSTVEPSGVDFQATVVRHCRQGTAGSKGTPLCAMFEYYEKGDVMFSDRSPGGVIVT